MTTSMFYGPLAFAITFAETWVSSRERGAERRSKTYRTSRFSAISANWSLLFETILLADIILTVAAPLVIAPWVLAGAWLGQFLACEKQRRKWRNNVGRVENLRKKLQARRIESSPDFGGTSAAPSVAVNAPTKLT